MAPFMTLLAEGLPFFQLSSTQTKAEEHAATCVDTTADTATEPASSALPPLKLLEHTTGRHYCEFRVVVVGQFCCGQGWW
jgi:hypothetical protein